MSRRAIPLLGGLAQGPLTAALPPSPGRTAQSQAWRSTASPCSAVAAIMTAAGSAGESRTAARMLSLTGGAAPALANSTWALTACLPHRAGRSCVAELLRVVQRACGGQHKVVAVSFDRGCQLQDLGSTDNPSAQHQWSCCLHCIWQRAPHT